MRLLPRQARSTAGRKERRSKNKTYAIRLLHFLDKIGMPYVIERLEDGIWNGQYLSIDLSTSNVIDCPLLLHEVSHWLLASTEQRQSPCFGLEASVADQQVDLAANKLASSIRKMLATQ